MAPKSTKGVGFNFDLKEAKTAYTRGQFWKVGKSATKDKHVTGAKQVLSLFTGSTQKEENGKIVYIDNPNGFKSETVDDKKSPTGKSTKLYPKGFIFFKNFALYGPRDDMLQFVEKHATELGDVSFNKQFVSYTKFDSIRRTLDAEAYNEKVEAYNKKNGTNKAFEALPEVESRIDEAYKKLQRLAETNAEYRETKAGKQHTAVETEKRKKAKEISDAQAISDTDIQAILDAIVLSPSVIKTGKPVQIKTERTRVVEKRGPKSLVERFQDIVDKPSKNVTTTVKKTGKQKTAEVYKILDVTNSDELEVRNRITNFGNKYGAYTALFPWIISGSVSAFKSAYNEISEAYNGRVDIAGKHYKLENIKEAVFEDFKKNLESAKTIVGTIEKRKPKAAKKEKKDKRGKRKIQHTKTAAEAINASIRTANSIRGKGKSRKNKQKDEESDEERESESESENEEEEEIQEPVKKQKKPVKKRESTVDELVEEEEEEQKKTSSRGGSKTRKTQAEEQSEFDSETEGGEEEEVPAPAKSRSKTPVRKTLSRTKPAASEAEEVEEPVPKTRSNPRSSSGSSRKTQAQINKKGREVADKIEDAEIEEEEKKEEVKSRRARKARGTVGRPGDLPKNK